jgi:hypothetical protein
MPKTIDSRTHIAPDAVQLWEMLRSKISDEDQWIRHRVSWNLASSSFLVAAFVASALAVPSGGRSLGLIRITLLYAIPTLGLLLSTAVLLGLAAATIAICQAQKSWPPQGMQEEQTKAFPHLYSFGWAVWLGRIASWGTTLLLIKFWLLALILVVVAAGGLRFAAY